MEVRVAQSQKYVDSFVMPVAKADIPAYEAFADKMAALAEKHGALEYVNCVADDVKPGKQTSYPLAVNLGDDEVVVCSWAVYDSREARDEANKAIMEDEAFKALGKNIPVDGKRMFTGGFRVLRGK
jgi:uncharacterized protein YbaA (DUF1428 family)